MEEIILTFLVGFCLGMLWGAFLHRVTPNN